MTDPRDLERWAIAAPIVVGIHVALIAGYHLCGTPSPMRSATRPPVVDGRARSDRQTWPTPNQRDIAPAPEETVEQKPTPPDVEKQPRATEGRRAAAARRTRRRSRCRKKSRPRRSVETPSRLRRKPPRASKAARRASTRRGKASLVRHLQQFKRYPSEAQSRSEEGVVVFGFSVDRTGHVLSHWIVRSSGHPDLDAEVMSMIERAQPLPAFPATMTQAQLDLTVPISFSLR